MKRYLILALLLTGCASSTQYEWKKDKWVPKSKMVNKGIDVKADHSGGKIENGIISFPKIELDN